MTEEILTVLQSFPNLEPCLKFRNADIVSFVKHTREDKCEQCLYFLSSDGQRTKNDNASVDSETATFNEMRCPIPIDLESRTSRALQEMFEAHQPSAWCFGHFHINRKFLVREAKFRCLAEMAGFEVVSCDTSVV